MRHRLALAAGVATTLALVAAIVYSMQPSNAAAELADALGGEHWYAVVLGHKPVGHYHAVNRRTEEGGFEFRTTLRFRLGNAAETRIEDRLVFHREAPHPLVTANHRVDAGDTSVSVAIDNGVAAIVDDDGARRRAVDAALAMRDYLATELALANAAPAAGEVSSSRAVDFDQLAVVTHRWRILRRVDNGTEIAKEGREHDTVVRLDHSFRPVWMRIGELFELQRVADERTARAWQSETPLFASTNHSVVLQGTIEQPSLLRRLVLAVEGDTTSWPTTITLDAELQPSAEGAEVDRARAATLRYPADDSEVRALAEHAVAGSDNASDKADALALFVHNLLDYEDVARPRTVFETLRDGRGDCTEFAHLYATLARAVGVPARTVVGLAYRRGRTGTGTFAPHAWNEVAIDGRWRSVDPTWGQTRLAATHLPLPADAELAAVAALPRLRFRVLEAHYGLPYDAAPMSSSLGEP